MHVGFESFDDVRCLLAKVATFSRWKLAHGGSVTNKASLVSLIRFHIKQTCHCLLLR